MGSGSASRQPRACIIFRLLEATPQRAREFFDGIARQTNDSVGVQVGKEMVRWGSIVVATGLAMVTVL